MRLDLERCLFLGGHHLQWDLQSMEGLAFRKPTLRGSIVFRARRS